MMMKRSFLRRYDHLSYIVALLLQHDVFSTTIRQTTFHCPATHCNAVSRHLRRFPGFQYICLVTTDENYVSCLACMEGPLKAQYHVNSEALDDSQQNLFGQGVRPSILSAWKYIEPLSLLPITIHSIPVDSIPIHPIHSINLLLLLLPIHRKPPQNPQLHPPQRTLLRSLQIHPRHRAPTHLARLICPKRLQPSTRAKTPLTTRRQPRAARA